MQIKSHQSNKDLSDLTKMYLSLLIKYDLVNEVEIIYYVLMNTVPLYILY